MERYPLAHVKWIDPYSVDEWTSEKNFDNLTIESFGFEIKSTEKNITLALNVDYENDTISCVVIIPKSAITYYKRVQSV